MSIRTFLTFAICLPESCLFIHCDYVFLYLHWWPGLSYLLQRLCLITPTSHPSELALINRLFPWGGGTPVPGPHLRCVISCCTPDSANIPWMDHGCAAFLCRVPMCLSELLARSGSNHGLCPMWSKRWLRSPSRLASIAPHQQLELTVCIQFGMPPSLLLLGIPILVSSDLLTGFLWGFQMSAPFCDYPTLPAL